MTEIGVVVEVLPRNGDWIVSIRAHSVKDLRIKIGDVLRFERSGSIEVTGLKFWSETELLDVLITNRPHAPEVGEAVGLEERQPDAPRT